VPDRRFDVAVVGGGIIGSACALEIARAGRSVVLLEATGIASDTSCRAMGHVGVYDDSPAQFALSKYGVDCWNELAPNLPPEVEYVRRGALWIAAEPEEMGEAEAKFRRYRDSGVEAHLVDSRRLSEMEPNLRRGLPGALYVPGDIVLDATEATRYLARAAQGLGAEVRVPARVRDLTDAGPVLGNGERVMAERTVLATGWQAPLLRPGLPIRPRKGHIALLAPRPGFAHHQLSEISYVHGARPEANDVFSFSLQPRTSGRYLLGATRQYVGTSTDVDPRVIEKLLARARRFIPDIDQLTIERTWAGLRPAGLGTVPIIGPDPNRPNLMLAVAHEGIGITTSVATGRIVADLLTGRRPSVTIEPFQLPAGGPTAGAGER
jgi:D-hydroxyproline dehydrogenase subunit beta